MGSYIIVPMRHIIPALLILLLAGFAAPAAAYDFPFNVVRFNPRYETKVGRFVDVKYPAGMTAEAALVRFVADADALVERACGLFGVAPPSRTIKVYLYESPEQKRRLVGSIVPSQIEDGCVHLVYQGPGQIAGDLVPVALGRAAGRSDSAFLNAGVRHLFEPVFGERLPEWIATSLEVEAAFAEFGLHRPLADMLRMDRAAPPLDDRGKVTAAAFVRFLLDRYGPEFLLAWYPGDHGFLRRFPKVYGFPLEDAERQWLGGLVKRRLPDAKFLELRDRFEALGMKTLR